MSEACADKHKSMSAELDWLSSIKVVESRYKISMVREGATSITAALESAPAVKIYRWLCTQSELDSAIAAVASAMKTTVKERCTKIVMKASTFVETLGAVDAPTD